MPKNARKCARMRTKDTWQGAKRTQNGMGNWRMRGGRLGVEI